MTGQDAGNSGMSDELTQLKNDARKVIEGFDHGIFCRDVSHDHESGWAVRALPYLVALGRLTDRLGVFAADKETGR